MARCSGREHPRGTTFAPRMNGRTRFVSLRYCGSKTSISPNFVCQRRFFYLGDASKVVDEFLSRSLPPGSRPILASPLAPPAAFPRHPLFDRVGLLEIFARICAAQKLSLGGVHGRCSAPSSTLPP